MMCNKVNYLGLNASFIPFLNQFIAACHNDLPAVAAQPLFYN